LAETGIDAQYNRSGLLMLATQECAAALHWAQENNRVMEEVSAARIYQQEPRLRAGFATGLWMPDVANVRNPRLCQALTASLAELPNVTLLEGCRVSGFEHNAGSIESVCVEHSANPALQRLQASKVIVSAGAWCQQLLAPLGLNVDVAPVKGQMLLYRFQQPPLASIVLTNGRYLIPRADGHLLVGSTLEQVGFDKEITATARTSLQDSAVQMLAELEHMSPLRQWAGLRPGAPDGLPFIGMLPGFSNLYINAGQYRNGLVLAPASARLLADSLLGRDTIVDPAPYQPAARMSESRPVTI
jgi:glycine oxidase